MNVAKLKSVAKWIAVITLLLGVVSAESCKSKGVYGRHKGGGRGCDCPSIGH